MFNHYECNRKLTDECIKFIELYRQRKENNIFDAFYHSHLDCFTSLIEDWKNSERDCYAVIACDFDFVQITQKSGVVLVKNVAEATMFDLSDDDLYDIFSYIKKQVVTDKYKIIPVDKILLHEKELNLWSDKNIQGNFAVTGEINEDFVKEV